jgi:hypothetical protein
MYREKGFSTGDHFLTRKVRCLWHNIRRSRGKKSWTGYEEGGEKDVRQKSKSILENSKK